MGSACLVDIDEKNAQSMVGRECVRRDYVSMVTLGACVGLGCCLVGTPDQDLSPRRREEKERERGSTDICACTTPRRHCRRRRLRSYIRLAEWETDLDGFCSLPFSVLVRHVTRKTPNVFLATASLCGGFVFTCSHDERGMTEETNES